MPEWFNGMDCKSISREFESHPALYLLKLWKDQILKYQRNQKDFAQNANERYIKQHILPIHIGQIGMVHIRKLYV